MPPTTSRLLAPFVLSLALTLAGAAQSQARTTSDCPPPYLSDEVDLNFSGVWGRGDSGVITDRFISIKNAAGQVVPTIHGIDLSRYNEGIDYGLLARCGAQFAFVRMDVKFQDRVTALTRAGIGFIPYFDFQRAARFKQASAYEPYRGKLEELATSPLVRDARAHGRALAQQFLDSYDKAKESGGKTFKITAKQVEFFAVDAEESNKSIDESKLNREFGLIYAATLVAFAYEIQKRHPELVPVIYTFPGVYTSYLKYADRQDDLPLSTYPAWVARNRSRGADVYENSAVQAIDRDMQRFCRVAGGDRCIFQQYSHRALIGYGLRVPWTANTVPPHHDINRMFPITTCRVGFGEVLVRNDTERSRCLE